MMKNSPKNSLSSVQHQSVFYSTITKCILSTQYKVNDLFYTAKEYVCSLLKMIKRWIMILTSAIHSKPLTFFVSACTRLTLKKLLAILLCTSLPQESYISWCISFLHFIYRTEKKKIHGNSHFKSAHCPTEHDGGG